MKVNGTSDYVYNNIRLDETRYIVENILHEYTGEYGGDIYRSVKNECVAKNADEIKNDRKNFTIVIILLVQLMKKCNRQRGCVNLLE